MVIERALAEVRAFTPPAFDQVCRQLPVQWIDQALQATGTASIRRRRLPAEQVIWLVLGIALYRNESIDTVVAKLDLALGPPERSVAHSALVQARARLGAEPMQWLFERSAEVWSRASAEAHRWRGLSLYGIDGTTLRVADSPNNRARFGGAHGARGPSAYPLLRLVTLMVLRSHLLAGASIGPYTEAELHPAHALQSLIADHSLTIVDRNFLSAALLCGLQAEGTERHWLVRAKSNTRWQVITPLSAHEALVEMRVSSSARRAHPWLGKRWRVRAIGYQRPGGKPQVLLTSLLDAERFPAQELVALYHERWELELGYDEIKTQMLEREETLRSRTPDGVRQELWGVLLAYNLVRLEMERVAALAGVPPSRVSFELSLTLFRQLWMWGVRLSPGTLPRMLAALRERLLRLSILPPRRVRTYPRAVKIKMSNYPRKRPEVAALNPEVAALN